MSKLQTLLDTAATLKTEVATTGAFIDRVHGKGTLHMTAIGADGEVNGIAFSPSDLGLELQVLRPITLYLVEQKQKLKEVQDKIAALELLLK